MVARQPQGTEEHQGTHFCMLLTCPIDGFEVDINLAENPISLRSQRITMEYTYVHVHTHQLCVCGGGGTWIALMMSRGDTTFGSYSKCPLLVAKATVAEFTPFTFRTLLSIWWTQEAHVMPLI